MPLPAFFKNVDDVNPEGLKPEDITAIGTIRGPGKFEGEMYYVPYYWYVMLDGGSDEQVCASSEEGEEAADSSDEECYEVFTLEGVDDQLKFPELKDVYSLWLYARSDGFVIAMHMSKKEDAAARRKLGAD